MCKGSDGLHFNGVSGIKAVVKNSWGIDYLPLGVVVFKVTEIKVLGGESIRLNIDICISNIIHQTRFTNIWESSKDQCSFVSIDIWESTQMLSYFFKVAQ